MDPVESPDGKKLAFSAMTHLYTMDLPAGKPQRLTTGSAHEFQPGWSPDGRSIVYVTWSSDGGQLWKIPAAGGTPVPLSKSLAVYSNPAWSPDGTKIVLLRGNAYDRENSTFDGGQTENADLIWIPADGGDANLILPARGAGGPHFTNDKDRIYVYTPQGWSRCATMARTAARIWWLKDRGCTSSRSPFRRMTSCRAPTVNGCLRM